MRIILVCLLFLVSDSYAQPQRQVVRGKVLDDHSGEALQFALISVPTAKTGAKSDSLGRFRLELPLGRHQVKISRGGYEAQTISEVLVTSSKEVDLEIRLQRTVNQEIVVAGSEEARIREIGAREFTVEQTSRIAGGFDDPARFATAFAGLTSGVSNNAIIVRGNSPTAIQWRLNGVEIPNPNHFADLQSFGGGGLTALSTQVISNSKFIIGALPAPYQNGLAGAFDITMREGNAARHEHTFQLGGIGIDAASEGPLGLGEGSSYLFNYRYSTLALIEPILPPEAAGTTFQDLSFNVALPSGTSKLNIWGFGLMDKSGTEPKSDTTDRKYTQDIEQQDADQSSYATGLTYKTALGAASLTSTLAYTERRLDLATSTLINNALRPTDDIETRQGDLSLSTSAIGEIDTGLYLLGGVRAVHMGFDLSFANSDGTALRQIIDRTGSALLLNSHVGIEKQFAGLKLEAGVAAQYLDLSEEISIEPRAFATFDLGASHSLGLGYGLHSRMERLNYYFIEQNDALPNQDLNFSKAHHAVIQYRAQIAEDLSIELSPYYQSLFDVPIVRSTPISLINQSTDWFFDRELHNDGKGRNYGIDLTLERPLTDGYYFLVSGSLLTSEYDVAGAWRSTRYDRIGVLNAVVGWEWELDDAGKNLLSLSVRGTYQGGLREMTLLEAASEQAGVIVLDTLAGFNRTLPSQVIAHLNASYRYNGDGHSWIIAFAMINATGAEEFVGYRRNLRTGKFEEEWDALVIPNLSIKLEF